MTESQKEPVLVGQVHLALYSDGRIDVQNYGTADVQCTLLTLVSDIVRKFAWDIIMKKSPSIIKPVME